VVDEVAVGQVAASEVVEMPTLPKEGTVSTFEQYNSSKDWPGART